MPMPMPARPMPAQMGQPRPMPGRMPARPMPAMPPQGAMARPPGMKKGGATHRCHERADGCAEKGHTKCKIVMCGGGHVKG